MILIDKACCVGAPVQDHRAVKDDKASLTHKHDQVLKVNQSEVNDLRKIHSIFLLEAKLLHDMNLQDVLNQVVLIDHKRDISCVFLGQKCKHCLFGLALASEKLCSADTHLAAVVKRLVMVLRQLRHHQIDRPMVCRVRSCNQFAGRCWLIRKLMMVLDCTATSVSRSCAEKKRVIQSARHNRHTSKTCRDRVV